MSDIDARCWRLAADAVITLQVTAVPSCLADFKAAPDSAGVDIIGLVSHAGLSVDEKVAGAVTDVDFIVSAHSHTQMYPGLLGPCLEFADGTCQCALIPLQCPGLHRLRDLCLCCQSCITVSMSKALDNPRVMLACSTASTLRSLPMQELARQRGPLLDACSSLNVHRPLCLPAGITRSTCLCSQAACCDQGLDKPAPKKRALCC